MKGTSIAAGVLVFVLFTTALVFAAQDGQPAAISTPKDAMGFQHYGQYVAAKHVSESLNISPNALRTQMLDNHLSLADAIKKLRPDLSSQTISSETKKAEAAAKKAEAAARYQPIDHIPPRLSN